MSTTIRKVNYQTWAAIVSHRLTVGRNAERVHRLLSKIATAHHYDPGETDLDDEQPVSASVDLGDVRLARELIR